jgi:hypothetical protein
MILDCPRCQHRFPVPAPVPAEDVRCPQCGTPCPLAAGPAVACAASLSPNAPLPATESASREDPGLLSTAAKLRHSNICPIYEIGQVGQRPYISMAYIEGQSLAHWAKARQPNARQAAEMVALLARAVAYWMGHRFHKLRQPAQADQLFATALSDAAPGSRLHRLAAAERARLQKKP